MIHLNMYIDAPGDEADVVLAQFLEWAESEGLVVGGTTRVVDDAGEPTFDPVNEILPAQIRCSILDLRAILSKKRNSIGPATLVLLEELIVEVVEERDTLRQQNAALVEALRRIVNEQVEEPASNEDDALIQALELMGGMITIAQEALAALAAAKGGE